VVDVKSEFLLAMTLHGGDAADTDTLCDNLLAAQIHLQGAGSETEVREVVADKGYRAAAMIEQCDAFHFRTYNPESRRPHPSRSTDKPIEYREAMIANRRRGKRLSRLRSVRVVVDVESVVLGVAAQRLPVAEYVINCHANGMLRPEAWPARRSVRRGALLKASGHGPLDEYGIVWSNSP
jgi:hypothetical protein